jgi:redox-sensitive bicupin YhaK (pirin superfamily)
MSDDTFSLRLLSRSVRGHATSDGGGVKLTRVIGTRELDNLDPFLLLDEFRSESSADYMTGFPDHPHRGFETVTYMLAGSMEHRDHLGNRGLLESGSVQWMTAGRGIVHSEMPRQEHGLMWGFQLWVNLQATEKLCEPRYQDIPPNAIPEVELPNLTGKVRVIAGSCLGMTGPVSGISVEPLYLDVALSPYTLEEFFIPEGHNACIYVFEGGARFGDVDDHTKKVLSRHDLGVLSQTGSKLRIQAASLGVRFLLLAARPLNEPVARYGPFVMNTREQVLKAVDDFRTGRFLSESGAEKSAP